MSWPVFALGEIVENHDARRIPLKQSDRAQRFGKFPYYGASGVIDYVDDYLFEGEYLLIGEDGANLLARSTPIAFHASGKFWVNNHAHVLSFNGKADLRYLAYYLNSISLKPYITGSAQPKLNQENLNSICIPLPALEEQKRIASILDKADAIRRKRQQAIKLADDFLRSVFLEMFGDPVTNPKGWEVKKLGQVSETQLGKMLSEKSKVGNSPKKYLRNANVRWREFDLEDMLEMDFDEREIKKFNLCKGDLLICEGGEIGRCAIWHGQLSECYFQKALHRLRVSPDIFTPEYVQEYFYWMSVNGGLVKSASEVTFSHLTAEKLKTLDVPIPPVALQIEFSSLYRKYDSLKRKVKNISNVDSNVFASLSQKAFSGGL